MEEETVLHCRSSRHRQTIVATVRGASHKDLSWNAHDCGGATQIHMEGRQPAKEPVMPHLHYSIEYSVAEFVIDNPPQNRIGDQFCADLVAAIDRAHVDGARAILLRSTGENFSYGATSRR